MLERVVALSTRDEAVNGLLLHIATALADDHAHRVEHDGEILRSFSEAVGKLKIEVPTGNTWRTLDVQVHNDRMGRMESLTIRKVE